MTIDSRIVIALDGPAGAGKSSVSREVARRLGLKYIDSGAIYRTITLFLLRKYDKIEVGRDYLNSLKELSISQTFNNDGTSSTFLNGVDVSGDIRDEIIINNIGIVSDDIRIRGYVNDLLREWSMGDSIIMEGRDIGTVVFPKADVKIYLDASVDVRACRRTEEFKGKGKTVDAEDIKNQIVLRDAEDSGRPFGSLMKADDSFYLDTSNMNKEEVIQRIIAIISS